MYHVIADPPAGAPFPELYVSPKAFSAQVSWLARHGFHAVTLKAAHDHWKLGSPLAAQPVVLTFDDGYRSIFTNALRILQRHHWPGVLNLEVENERVSWGLSPRRIRSLIAADWEIDAHTITHPDLTQVDAAQLRREVAGSRSIIRRQFHVPVDFFCYPSGRYNAAVIREVRRAGYLGATTTNLGLARPSDLYTLRRVRVNRSDGVAGLAATLSSLGAAGR